jgi:hypothetical protein
LIQQIEGLAVTGDFDTNHSNHGPMEEIKLSEVVVGADQRHCRRQLGNLKAPSNLNFVHI